MNLREIEEFVQNYWTIHKCFEKSLEINKDKPLFTFYDGPPFATGLPHYGHILAGTIKDVVTRYWHQRGYNVERRFGWDCHGLPVEYEIDKRDGILTRSQVDGVNGIGIAEYNRRCREIVMRNSLAWEKTITRMGRWIDFKNDYKTMNINFMESVWWVFATMYKKGYIYEGEKVMPFSIGCATPLSNFEAGENYQEVSCTSIYVAFESCTPTIYEDVTYPTNLLVWTTTPWTLVANYALCVNNSIEYVKFLCMKRNRVFIAVKNSLPAFYNVKPATISTYENKLFKYISSFTGATLVGEKYRPIYNFVPCNNQETQLLFTVLADNYVTDVSGTGIVHLAPAFGEDDYRVCQLYNLINIHNKPFCPVDDNGYYTTEVGEYSKMHILSTVPHIITALKATNVIVKTEVIKHNYPYCWRSNTPLIYKIVPAWFVNVPLLRNALIQHNNAIRWVPENIGSKRFHNWLEDSRPWCISRSRFWGTPIPVWQATGVDTGGNTGGNTSVDTGGNSTRSNTLDVIVIESVEQLKQLSGRNDIVDLHRDYIDDIIIYQNGIEYKRVDYVFDCWFESGSMPYAQQHYPFENKEKFERGFPADFIAEGLDQTRGWFYTLLVISTALFDRPPFMNVIVNGLVLAADGEKMSKSKKNYDPPDVMYDKYGADPIRLCLINSPAVHADPIKFKEEGIHNMVRDVFIPWYNIYKLWYDTIDLTKSPSTKSHSTSTLLTYTPSTNTSTNVLDKWIMSKMHELIYIINVDMQHFDLHNVVPQCIKFIDQVSKWYINILKDDIKANGPSPAYTKVMFYLCNLMAPFTPHMSEYIYYNMKLKLQTNNLEDICPNVESIHYLEYPIYDEKMHDVAINVQFDRLQSTITLARQIQNNSTLRSRRFTMNRIEIYHNDVEFLNDVKKLEHYLLSQLNITNVEYNLNIGLHVIPVIEPNCKSIGKKYGKKQKHISKQITEMSIEEIYQFINLGYFDLDDVRIELEDVHLTYEEIKTTLDGGYTLDQKFLNGLFIKLDMQITNVYYYELGIVRELIYTIQKYRKDNNIIPETVKKITTYTTYKSPKLSAIINNQLDYLNDKFKGMFEHVNLVNAVSDVASYGDNAVTSVINLCPVNNQPAELEEFAFIVSVV